MSLEPVSLPQGSSKLEKSSRPRIQFHYCKLGTQLICQRVGDAIVLGRLILIQFTKLDATTRMLAYYFVGKTIFRNLTIYTL